VRVVLAGKSNSWNYSTVKKLKNHRTLANCRGWIDQGFAHSTSRTLQRLITSAACRSGQRLIILVHQILVLVDCVCSWLA
jgi:hypothetical protein